MRARFVPAVPLFTFLASVALSQTPLPIGDESQVNTYSTHRQGSPSVAVLPGGDFVIVWNSNHTSQDPNVLAFDVRGQRYDAAGNRVGDEFQINTYTTSTQESPEISMAADGRTIVVWGSVGSLGTDTSQWSVQGQRYDGTGSALGDEFQINEYSTGRQWHPSVAMKSDGSFVVVWESAGSSGTDTSGNSIQGLRFDSTGNPVGSEFQVNTYTTYGQYQPSVAIDTAGNFVVVWYSYGSGGNDTSVHSIQGQRYDANGLPVGAEFQVNSYTTSYQWLPRVATTTDDGFVVVWSSWKSDSDPVDGVVGQRYDKTGGAIGGEFQVNTYTTSSQSYWGQLSVAAASDGGFVVVWNSNGSYGNDDSSYSVQGQRFSVDAIPVGSQFQVNSYTTGSQGHSGAAVGSGGSGNFVVAWDSYGSSGSDTDRGSIQARRFVSPLYADGFESGDTSAWSSTVQ